MASSESNRRVVSELLQRVFVERRDEAIDEYYDAKLVPTIRPHVAELLSAFPDLDVRIDEIIAEGDLVAVRLTVSGTHRGTFAGVPPTERRIEYGAMRFYRIAGGRVAESWAVQDRLGLFQQLGLVPDGLGGVNWAAGSSQRR
jgi:predicted ester cyclase